MGHESGQPPETMTVEVAYAEPERQHLEAVTLPTNSTVEDAIKASGLREAFPNIVIDPKSVGIFGRKVPIGQSLNAGDRVEVYRPLLADPKAVRRARAEEQKN